MFTGIVAAVGVIESVRASGPGSDAGVILSINAGVLGMEDVAIGDSISINGACMTVTSKTASGFSVDVSRESLLHTVGLDAPGPINLEKAMALGDKIGGHLVSGHVDGVGEVTRFESVGESFELVIRIPGDLAKFFAYKGSAAINGVSLTVNRVIDGPDGSEISINLIPHTLVATTLHALTVGAKVNLEIDLIARYCERLLTYRPNV